MADEVWKERCALPLFSHRHHLLQTLYASPPAPSHHSKDEDGGGDTLVLQGETGCGKTTQVPQYLIEHSLLHDHLKNDREGRTVACTQPRRVAALSAAERVRYEMRHTLPHALHLTASQMKKRIDVTRAVSHCVRFDDQSNEDTLVLYITDGMLLREVLHDPLLMRYKCIILDEAHERSLNTDTLLATLKRVQRERRRQNKKVLKLIVMSATLDAEKFSAYLYHAPIIHVSGRQFPVQIFHAKKAESDLVDATVNAVIQLHLHIFENTTTERIEQALKATETDQECDGDVLAFLPGQEEIDSAVHMLQERAAQMQMVSPKCIQLLVLPMYAALSQDQQMSVFQPTPPRTRKVIIATNIAETSVTLPNIVHVIDSGLTKTRIYDGTTCSESLTTINISKAEAIQRTGRAGRVRSGKCYRLYTEARYDNMLESRLPEIQRSNLSAVTLWLKALRITDVQQVDFLDKPSKKAIALALESLLHMQAIDQTGALTELGSLMARLPLDPLYARAVVLSTRDPFCCSEDMLATVSMLSVEQVWLAHHHNLSLVSQANKRANRETELRAKLQLSENQGDHVALMNALFEYQKMRTRGDKATHISHWCIEHGLNERGLTKALRIYDQLHDLLKTLNLPLVRSSGTSALTIADERKKYGRTVLCCHASALRFCLAHTMRSQIARRGIMPGIYSNSTAALHALHIHPSSTLHNKSLEVEFLVYDEIVKTAKSYMRYCTRVEPLWIHEMEGQPLDITRGVKSSAVTNRLATLGNLLVSSLPAEETDARNQSARAPKKRAASKPLPFLIKKPKVVINQKVLQMELQRR